MSDIWKMGYTIPMIVDEDAPNGRCICGDPFDDDGRCPTDKVETGAMRRAFERYLASQQTGDPTPFVKPTNHIDVIRM